MSADLYMPEEHAAIVAIRTLAERLGKRRADGSTAAPSRQEYDRAILEAQRTDADSPLAAAPRSWWISMYTAGWSALVQAANLPTPWATTGRPVVTRWTAHKGADRTSAAEMHPPLPPMSLARTEQRPVAWEDARGQRHPAAVPVDPRRLGETVTVHMRTREIWSLR